MVTDPHVARFGGLPGAFEPDLDAQQEQAERIAAGRAQLAREQARAAARRRMIDGLGTDALAEHDERYADPWQA